MSTGCHGNTGGGWVPMGYNFNNIQTDKKITLHHCILGLSRLTQNVTGYASVCNQTVTGYSLVVD